MGGGAEYSRHAASVNRRHLIWYDTLSLIQSWHWWRLAAMVPQICRVDNMGAPYAPAAGADVPRNRERVPLDAKQSRKSCDAQPA